MARHIAQASVQFRPRGAGRAGKEKENHED